MAQGNYETNKRDKLPLHLSQSLMNAVSDRFIAQNYTVTSKRVIKVPHCYPRLLRKPCQMCGLEGLKG